MTTTFHCEKLCSCDTCAPTRWALSYDEGFGKPLGSYAAGLFRESAAYTAAWFASRDPAKLAEVMAIALGARGFVNSNKLRITCWEHPTTKVLMIGIWSPKRCENFDCDMPTARLKLLAIMATPANKTSRGGCERILKGKP